MPIEYNSLNNPDGASKEFELGVLLVHGIGMQPPLDTLVRWTDTLIEVINKANPDSLVASVHDAGTGQNSSDRCAELELDLRRGQGGKSEQWLITEGWWGDAFPMPTYRELFSWSLRALPWAIACYLVRFGQVLPDKQAAESLGAGRWNPKALTHRVTAFLLLPIILLILGVLLVLGILPIPQVRSFVMSAQSVLTGTVGDSLAFVESPVRAALIRSRVLDALKSLKSRCDKTIVIAHSQGAAVCVDALGGITSAKASNQHAEAPAPDTLLTFGAGTNPLVNLKGKYAKLFSYVVWIEVLSMYVTFGLLGFLVWKVHLQEICVVDAMTAVSIAAASFIAGAITFIVLGFGAWAIWTKLKEDSKNKEDSKSLGDWFASLSTGHTIGIMFLIFFSATAATIFSVMRFDLAPLPIVLIGGATLAFLFSISNTIARMAMELAQIHIPHRLRRWIDLYASSDPVPNGPTRVDEDHAESKSEASATDAHQQNRAFDAIEIYNEGSILTDHTTYWENLDGFVLRVIHACAETAGSSWRHDLPAVTASGDRRARWRVKHLRFGRWLLTLGSLAALVLLWGRFQDSPPVSLGLPEWTRPMDLVILILVVWVVASRALRLPWHRWVRSEQEQVIAGSPPHSTPWRPFVLMGVVLGLFLLLMVAMIGGDASLLQRPTVESTGLILLFIAAGIGLEVIARWLMPAPNV